MSKTPISDRFLDNQDNGGFIDFVDKVETRLRSGKETYGDASFQGPLKLEEIQEELLDVAGWAAIQWEKIERLRRHIAKVTEDQKEIDKAMTWVEETMRDIYNVWDDGDLRSL